MHYLSFLQYGFNQPDLALLLNRFALGLFFVLSGYHKLFNAKRHASLVAVLKSTGVPLLPVMQWFVPCVEFFGGLSLLSGILAPLASMGLMIVCLVACLTDGLKRIPAMQPIDDADYCDDVLYLPEALYCIGLAIIICFGPGSVTLIALVTGQLFG